MLTVTYFSFDTDFNHYFDDAVVVGGGAVTKSVCRIQHQPKNKIRVLNIQTSKNKSKTKMYLRPPGPPWHAA